MKDLLLEIKNEAMFHNAYANPELAIHLACERVLGGDLHHWINFAVKTFGKDCLDAPFTPEEIEIITGQGIPNGYASPLNTFKIRVRLLVKGAINGND